MRSGIHLKIFSLPKATIIKYPVSQTIIACLSMRAGRIYYYYKYKKQLQKIERKVGMEYQKAYKQG